jgi:hypothetical protein
MWRSSRNAVRLYHNSARFARIFKNALTNNTFVLYNTIKVTLWKVIGCWILDAGCWILDAGFWMLDTGYWILDSGYWILDTGYWILASSIEHRVSSI